MLSSAKRGITDEQQALRDVLAKFETEGLDGGKKEFCSGKTSPDLGDIAVYGTLRSVEGLPVHEEFVVGIGDGNTVVGEWYERVKSRMEC